MTFAAAPRYLRGGVRRVRRAALPIAGSLLVLATGMAYFFWWGAVVGSPAVWVPPGDIWATIRSSDYVVWGYFGGIYSAGTKLVTFPGILLVLAPVSALSNALRLQEAFPFMVPHPTAWLVIGPYVLLVGCLPLFAFDALGVRMGLSMARRALLMVGEVIVIWQVLVLWGHPEDTIAIGVACYALMATFDGRWVAAGWLFGIALAFQPLVLLIYPVALIALSRHPNVTVREWAGMFARSVVVPVALLAAPLISNWRASTRALVDQPNFPTVDHPTPWLVLAPHLSRARSSSGLDEVSAGPPRAIAVITAIALAWRSRRWSVDLPTLTWLASACLAVRCFFEAVMVPYYVWPAIGVALVSAARRGVLNLTVCLAAGLGATVWSYVRIGSWSYWLVLVLLLALMLTAAVPVRFGALRLVRGPVVRQRSATRSSL